MDKEQILAIINGGENDEVEFKQDLGNLQTLSKTICSLGNTKGGVIIFGIDNRRTLIGIEGDRDTIQQKISSAAETIYPTPSINFDFATLDGKDLLVLAIQPAFQNSYFTYQGAIFVRVGSTTRRLEGLSQLEFLRRKQILTFDEGTIRNVTLEDLDKAKVMDYMSRKGHGTYLDSHGMENFLLNTMLATRTTELNIKNSAILLFGKEPTRSFPQAEIKLVRFLGTDPVRILDHLVVQEDVINSIERAISFIVRNIRRGMEVGEAPQRREVFEYPEKVFREAIVNAVVHRDYFSKDSIQISIFEDRIDIINPGSLPGGLDRDLFGYVSIQRNPIIYRFLRDIGYVEGYGTGIPRMRTWMREAGLRDPVFTITENLFRITLFNASVPMDGSQPTPTDRMERIIQLLTENEALKSKDLARMLSVTVPTVTKDLRELIDKNKVEKVGQYKGAFYRLRK